MAVQEFAAGDTEERPSLWGTHRHLTHCPLGLGWGQAWALIYLLFLTLWSVAVCPLLSPVHFSPFLLSNPAPTTRPQRLSK